MAFQAMTTGWKLVLPQPRGSRQAGCTLLSSRRGPRDEVTGNGLNGRSGLGLQKPLAVFWPALLRQGDYDHGEFWK